MLFVLTPRPGTLDPQSYWLFQRIPGADYPTYKQTTKLQCMEHEDLLQGGKVQWLSHGKQMLHQELEAACAAGQIWTPNNVSITIEQVKRRAVSQGSGGKEDKTEISAGQSAPSLLHRQNSRVAIVARTGQASPRTPLSRLDLSGLSTTVPSGSTSPSRPPGTPTLPETWDQAQLNMTIPKTRCAEDGGCVSLDAECPEPGDPRSVEVPLEDDVDSDNEEQREELVKNQIRANLWKAAVEGGQGNPRWQCERAAGFARKEDQQKLARSLDEWADKHKKSHYLSKGEIEVRSVEEVVVEK